MKNAKKTISLLVAVIMIIAMLPISVFAEAAAGKIQKSDVLAENFSVEKLDKMPDRRGSVPTRGEGYILSGIPENVEVYVNGVVQVPVDGTLKIEAGAEVVVKPSKGYRMVSFNIVGNTLPDYCRVIFEAEDVWGDGTGFQMLLDEDANAIDTVYTEYFGQDGLYGGGDLPAAFYDEFEYMIPENADGSVNTQNMLCGQIDMTTMPGGVYDLIVLNPDPSANRFYVGGGANDYEFETGYEYYLVLYYDDGAALGIAYINPIGFDFTYDEEEDSCTFIMPAEEVTMECVVEEHYEPDAPASIIWDFEEESDLEGWTFIDSDNDGFNWFWHYNGDTARYNTHSGEGILTSASYDNDNLEALFPDNWAITPAIVVPASGAELGFWYSGQDQNYCQENMAVYIGTSNDPLTMTLIGGDYTAAYEYTEQYIDLRSYAGQTVYIGFRHYDVTDMFYLNLDDVIIYGSDETPAENINVIVPVAYGFSEGTEYSVNGSVVTVTYSAPCKVGYIPAGETDYVAIAPVAVEGQENTYTFTAPEGVEEVLLVVKGDANLDSNIKLADSTLVKAHYNGRVTGVTMTAEQIFAGNVIGENAADIKLADSTKIKSVYNGRVTGDAFTWELK